MSTRRDPRKRGSAPAKSTHLQVRVDDPEKEAFEAAAILSGLGLSAWVRERLRRAARRELEDAGQKIAFLDYSGGEVQQ